MSLAIPGCTGLFSNLQEASCHEDDYIPGPINTMADFLSQRWDLTDDQILSHFNSHFP